MKADIHPKWYPEAQVTCTCGNKFVVGATKPEIKVEICSACHPFFTGEEKLVDTAGRVERFEEKRAKAVKKPLKRKERKLLKKEAEEKEEEERPRTLREMLRGK